MREIETQTREIDGVLFRVTPMSLTAARRGLVKLAKVVGPSLAQAMNEAPSLDALKADMAGANLVDAVSSFMDKISDQDLEWFEDQIGKHSAASMDGGDTWPALVKANRDQIFQGRLLLYFRWLAFGLEANYSDFFGWLRSAADDAGPEGGTAES